MVKPLLEMKSIPMSIEYKINNARYEIVNVNVPVEITQNNNVYEMRMEPAKLNMDKIEVEYSQVYDNSVSDVKKVSQQGNSSLYEVSSSYADKGNFKLDIKILKNTNSKIAIKRFESDVNFNLSSWEPQDISLKYDFNSINFGVNGDNSQFKFIPGNIEFIIKEYPRIEYKYLGEPIYVPESANPNYKPIDILV